MFTDAIFKGALTLAITCDLTIPCVELRGENGLRNDRIGICFIFSNKHNGIVELIFHFLFIV